MNLIPIEQLQVKINEYMKHYTLIERLTYFETDFTLGVEWAEQQLKPLFIEFVKWLHKKYGAVKPLYEGMIRNKCSEEDIFNLFLKEKYES